MADSAKVLAALGAVPLAMLLIGRDRRVAWLSPAALDLFTEGAQGLNYEGLHYTALLRQPRLTAAIETCLRTATKHVVPYVHSTAGSETTYRATCAPAPDENGRAGAVLVSFEDVSQIEEASQMRQDFVANVSHELRTPLAALMGLIETLRGPARDDSAARARFLGMMEAEAGRMNRLIAGLLSLARVEAEERRPPEGTVDLAELVASVVDTLQPVIAGCGARIAVRTEENPVPVPGEAEQLRQVLQNLIENAVKYGHAEGGGSEVTITLSTSGDSRCRMAVIEVADRGPGIAPHHIARLTERFYRVDDHRSRAGGGTGLGLAIVKHILNRHRGRLKIASSRGQGSTFTVFLPLAAPAARQAKRPK